MRYMLLIHTPESHFATLNEEQIGELMQAYGAYDEALRASGAFGASDRLQPSATATTVRVRDGKASATDGPFTETKETLGGYYIIDVPNLDEAIEWAKKIPSATYGSVEIRPIWEEE